MSFCTSDQNVLLPNFSRKANARMDLIDKLKLINDMDNGQCKAEIAKKYGVHAHTINYTYKQKESILRRYTQVCNILVKDVNCVNLDKTLLEWFMIENKSGNVVNEDILRHKAHDIVKKLKLDFVCTDEWLLDFRIRHNIAKYTSDIECSAQVREEFTKFVNCFTTEEVYIGGVCALAHRLDFNKYVSGHVADSYVSLMLVINMQGSDKRQLAVVGQQTLDSEINLRSLPVNYYYCYRPQVNYFVIHSYLKKWDAELILQKRYVSLLMNVPDKALEQLHLQNIKVISMTNMKYGSKILEKAIECFKFHYRKFQINKIIAENDLNDHNQETELHYIHMMSKAWCSVSCRYIQHLFHPREIGSLYFNIHNYSGENHNLSKWCKTNNILFPSELSSNVFDKYILCDKDLPCLNLELKDETLNTCELNFPQSSESASGIEGYQAMKRLLSYLQGEDAADSVIKYAKLLENHLEYGALLQMHQITANTND